MFYRERIYQSYRSTFLGHDRPARPDDVHQAARSYRFYFRGFISPDKDSRILDVGCGSGIILKWLKQEGYRHVTGIDVSPEQVEAARERLDNIIQGEGVSFLSTRSEEFDLIIAVDLIEHLKKEELLEFLDACRDALRRGGCLLVQTPNLAAPRGPALRYGDFTHELGLTPTGLRSLFRLAGFDNYEARECGPVPHGVLSSLRFVMWRVMRLWPLIFDYVEIGGNEFPVYTRNFIATAVKR